jgi:hypothetical protein
MAELRGHPLAARSRAREFTRLGRDWLDAWMQWAWSRQD